MVKKEDLINKIIEKFRIALPVAIVGGIVAIILTMVLGFITSFVPDFAVLISLVVSMILILLTAGMLKTSQLKVLENIPNLVVLVVSILIINNLIALIPIVQMISPYLISVGAITWSGLAMFLAELMVAFVIVEEAKKRLKV